MPHTFTALVTLQGNTSRKEVTTYFNSNDSLSVSIQDSSRPRLNIMPFTPSMFFVMETQFQDGLTYQISGNNVGYLMFGGNNKEGEGKYYSLTSTEVSCSFFKAGLRFNINAQTDWGSELNQGSVDSNRRNKLGPTKVFLDFFILTSEFERFFEQEKENPIFSKSTRLESLIKNLNKYAPKYNEPKNS